MIAFYQLGHRLAAFGVGPLVDAGVGLPTVHALASVVALAMGMLSFAVARRPGPASLHSPPEPAAQRPAVLDSSDVDDRALRRAR